MRAAGWYYDIKDFINDNGITAPGMGLGSNCLYNIDHMKLYGTELEAALKIGKRFEANAAYVYQDFDVEETAFEKDWTYYLPALLPKNKVKLLARYEVWRGGWLQGSSRFVDKRKAQKGEELDAYVTLDLGFEQKLIYDEAQFTAGIFINNVTGTVYQEQAGYKMPRQVWGLQLSAQF